MEEGLESCHRADCCNRRCSEGLVQALALSPRLGNVEVESSVFCHISLVFNLADGVKPSPWEKGSHSLDRSTVRIFVDVSVWSGTGLCHSPSEWVSDRKGLSTS